MLRNYSVFDADTTTTTRFSYNEETKEVVEQTFYVNVFDQTETPLETRTYTASTEQQNAFAFAETSFLHDENGNRIG